MWLKTVFCWEVRLCWMKLSHLCWRQHCLFVHGITFLGLIFPFFEVWIPIGPAYFFFSLHPSSILLNYQISLHPSYLNSTFIPPNYFYTHLNTVQLSWTHRRYIYLTRLHKLLLCSVKTKNDHRVFFYLVSAKDVPLCRMYWLDKSVRLVAFMLLMWFGYHSTLLQCILSGFFTSSVFGWRFQNRHAWESCTLKSDLLETWCFIQFMSLFNFSKIYL